MSSPAWTPTRELLIEQGPVVIAQTRTDPGDMGEPRVFESDGTTYVAVPDFDGVWSIGPDDLRLAVAEFLHAIDCGEPLFGESRCERCSTIHDSVCRQKDPSKPHEQRWCEGNTYDVTLREVRKALEVPA